MTETRGVDILVLEAMLSRYVHNIGMRHRTVVQSEPQPLSFFLALLSREAERRGVGFRSGFSGPGGDRAIYKQLSEILNNHTGCSANDSLNDVVLLPRSVAIRLCRKLQQQQPLARQLHILVERLLGALEDSAITVRAAAVRAVAGVVDADPRILSWDSVRVAVERRMSDHGTMVRSAIMDLLGKHVVEDPSIAEKYYPSIVEGISLMWASAFENVSSTSYMIVSKPPPTSDTGKKPCAPLHSAFWMMTLVFKNLWFAYFVSCGFLSCQCRVRLRKIRLIRSQSVQSNLLRCCGRFTPE